MRSTRRVSDLATCICSTVVARMLAYLTTPNLQPSDMESNFPVVLAGNVLDTVLTVVERAGMPSQDTYPDCPHGKVSYHSEAPHRSIESPVPLHWHC